MIYWMMDEKGNDRLGDLVLSLSHMFRYSSHWEDGTAVTLREEVEQIGHYLTIIQTRLEGRLQVEIDIDEKWMDIAIPKMTVQPIIENAVKHGLESLDRLPGLLKVYTRATGQTLRILIEDNGNGMSKKELERLVASLSGEAPTGKSKGGIGLQNLHLRLKYMFGEAYGLEIGSELGAGTIVSIVLPLLKEGEVNA